MESNSRDLSNIMKIIIQQFDIILMFPTYGFHAALICDITLHRAINLVHNHIQLQI